MDVVGLGDGGGALGLAAGAPAVAYLVTVTRGLWPLPGRVLPALATAYAVAWVAALAAAGRVDDHPVALVLHGVVLGQAAAGAAGWYRTYRAPAAGAEGSAAAADASSVSR